MSKPPAFTDTMQIGIVVHDLDATVRRYEEDYGIGPWTFWDVNPEEGRALRQYGEVIERRTRCATIKIGHVWWELIQPLDSESVHAKFLAEKGEGVHHIAVQTPNYDAVVAMHAPTDLPLQGNLMNVDVSYLPTENTLGVMLEVFNGEPPEAD